MGATPRPRSAAEDRWRRRADAMAQVDRFYRRLPPPFRAVAWLPVLYAARRLGLTLPPWPWG